ncbi:MAG: N-6 DNA methylase [Desulfurococcales archaeon]|nr:N-6 DNA methylase [Desulfurococcales archaeon]
MPRRRKQSKANATLIKYMANVSMPINIYEFVDKIHNMLYKMEGAGGLDAAKRLLPILGYIIREARNRGGTEEAVKQVVEEMTQDVRRARAEKLIPFIIDLEGIVEDKAVKNFMRDIRRAVEGIGVSTLENILRVIAEKQEIRRALVNHDALGALFEKIVYEAFKGGAGQYLTHRNLVITMREIAWSEFEAEGINPRHIKVYDPCAGSARFLAFWLEKILKSYPEYQNPSRLRDYAEQHLFATDTFEEMVGIAAVNMVIMGNGVANIFRADATNHFGPVVNLRSMTTFLKSFNRLWDEVKARIRTTRADVVEGLKSIEGKVYTFSEHVLNGLEKGVAEIKVNSDEFLAFISLLLSLRDFDIALKRLEGLRELSKLVELPPIAYLMKKVLSRRNSGVRQGFDLILTNPPMGRQGRGDGRGELLVRDEYILAQYALAQNKWLRAMTRKELQELARRFGTSPNPERIADKLGREWVTPEDYGYYKYKLILKDSELGWCYVLYYDDSMKPILLWRELPIQVIMLEQFLRVVRLGGKVFTVMDVGVLNNPGDEWVRRLLLTARHVPVKAKLKAVIELPHGAFYYTGAGTKTALLFYERVDEIPEDYEFFIALAEYVGYDTHSKSAEPLKENDLPLIIAEYLKWVGKKPEYYEKCVEEWRRERTCSWWMQEFEVIR